MDIYLTAAADALARRAMTTEHHLTPSTGEDAYYAQHTLGFTMPRWVSPLLALARRTHLAPARVPAARHA